VSQAARAPHESWQEQRLAPVHPAWLSLIRLCRELDHGEIERLRIQDGLPVVAEVTRKKVRLV